MSSFASRGWTTLRAVCNGVNAATPSSVSFSIRNCARSPFGSGAAISSRNGAFALRRLDGPHFQHHGPPADLAHLGGVLAAVAVEQANGVAGAEPADHGEMMRFRPLDLDRARRQRTIDVESVGHLC